MAKNISVYTLYLAYIYFKQINHISVLMITYHHMRDEHVLGTHRPVLVHNSQTVHKCIQVQQTPTALPYLCCSESCLIANRYSETLFRFNLYV